MDADDLVITLKKSLAKLSRTERRKAVELVGDVVRAAMFDDAAGELVTAHLDIVVVEDAGHGRQKVEGDGAVHEQRFSGVTGRVALGLGVFSHANGYVEVGFGVDVGVADALKMLDHRNGRFGRETGDEALAAARNKHVDVVAGTDELAHQGAVGGFDELDGACGEAFFGKASH